MNEEKQPENCKNFEEELEKYREQKSKDPSKGNNTIEFAPSKLSQAETNRVIKYSYFMKNYFAPPAFDYESNKKCDNCCEIIPPVTTSCPIDMDNNNFNAGRRFSIIQCPGTTEENQEENKSEGKKSEGKKSEAGGDKGRFSI